MELKDVYPNACLSTDFLNGSPIYSIWTSTVLEGRGLIGLGKTETEAWKNAELTIKRYNQFIS